MQTVIFMLRITASILLGIVALVSLFRSLFLDFKLIRAQGESYGTTSLKIAALNFLAGAAVSLIVFVWHPVLLLLPVLLGMSLVWAFLAYQTVASPYQLASFFQKLVDRQKRRGEREN